MALDANLFLGALGFYDQHREMRLDIDNMTYEVCFSYDIVRKLDNIRIDFSC